MLDRSGTGAWVKALGPDHAAVWAPGGDTLLVTFEQARKILTGETAGRTLAAHLAEPAGWSRLTLVAHGATWFRDPAVFGFFDERIDAEFFDGFERVVFYGAGMCGYAACAYSVAAPGAAVVALAPQATLDPARLDWDRRFLIARRRDFATRYGYAPDMIEAAACAAILYDPAQTLDAMHAALFDGANVLRLAAPCCGDALEAHLAAMGVLPELIDAAGEGQLSSGVYHRLFRARRRHAPYLAALMERLDKSGRTDLAARVCRHARRIAATETASGHINAFTGPRTDLDRQLRRHRPADPADPV
ncbi:phosphoadenosine phosphosulfate reductase [Rhodovulum sp. MB263]|uniref:phosphoadenosine phosphosulfate reductase n=1 Tax=Rhodovulum sp. (strain MB263) TaxID=308754 RepID=UPI0012DB25ED|nr:phosphoadenosine phosphosulfate reductase [Rhodovulum sp. MB263]